MANYDQLIYDTAIRNGFSPVAAKLVVAQARFESKDYTSPVFKNNLNTSGMKYIGQPLATRGTLAPPSERSASCRAGGTCVNSDYYAKFASVEDAVRDKIERNYAITRKGVTPEQLKNASSAEEFARLLKIRGYYGDDEKVYISGLKAKLLRFEVVDYVRKNPTTVVLAVAAFAGLAYYSYWLYKNRKLG